MSTYTEEAPPSLLSLPDEIIASVLARVTKKYYPILSCVSKKLRSLISSSELHKTRYLLGKHCFYVCLEESSSKTKHWFSLNENHRLVMISTPSLPERYSAVTMVGPEIYFLCDYEFDMSIMILDPRSGKLRQGPRRFVNSCVNATMGLVDEKIYVFGTSRGEKIKAQVLDLNTQIWQVAPTPTPSGMHSLISSIWPNINIALKISGSPYSSPTRRINPRNSLGAVMVFEMVNLTTL